MRSAGWWKRSWTLAASASSLAATVTAVGTSSTSSLAKLGPLKKASGRAGWPSASGIMSLMNCGARAGGSRAGRGAQRAPAACPSGCPSMRRQSARRAGSGLSWRAGSRAKPVRAIECAISRSERKRAGRCSASSKPTCIGMVWMISSAPWCFFLIGSVPMIIIILNESNRNVR